jgi:hypothetical protein
MPKGHGVEIAKAVTSSPKKLRPVCSQNRESFVHGRPIFFLENNQPEAIEEETHGF